MATKVLVLNTDGSLQEITPITTSGGAGSSGLIPALNASGVWDISFMPSGLGTDTTTATASETITAGAFVNMWNNGGVQSVRNAIAADNTKPANGFCLNGYSTGNTATVYLGGPNTLVPLGTFVVANCGKKVYLSPTVSGGCTLTIPTTTGQIAQVLGTIESVGASYIVVGFTEQVFAVRA